MKHDGLGPLVAGAQEELGFTPTADRLLGPLALSTAGGLQELMDLRSQEFGLTGGGGPDGTVAQQMLLWDDRATAPARKSSLLFQPSELRDDLLVAGEAPPVHTGPHLSTVGTAEPCARPLSG